MAFQEINDNINKIQEDSKEFLETNIAYYKLWGFKVAMKSTTLVFKFFLILLFALLFIVFFSTALALLIGNLLDSYMLGFLIVAGFYFLLTIVVLFVKSKGVERLLLRRFSEIFFND